MNSTSLKLKVMCIKRYYQESERPIYKMRKSASHISEKDQVSRIKRKKKFYNLITKKQSTHFKNWVNNLN